jgi:hypothetical protein
MLKWKKPLAKIQPHPVMISSSIKLGVEGNSFSMIQNTYKTHVE